MYNTHICFSCGPILCLTIFNINTISSKEEGISGKANKSQTPFAPALLSVPVSQKKYYTAKLNAGSKHGIKFRKLLFLNISLTTSSIPPTIKNTGTKENHITMLQIIHKHHKEIRA